MLGQTDLLKHRVTDIDPRTWLRGDGIQHLQRRVFGLDQISQVGLFFDVRFVRQHFFRQIVFVGFDRFVGFGGFLQPVGIDLRRVGIVIVGLDIIERAVRIDPRHL